MQFDLISTNLIDQDFNGVPYQADIRVEMSSDYDDNLSDLEFDSEEEREAYILAHESVYLRVTASAFGATGTDALGGCHIRVNRYGQDIQDVLKDHGMIEEALADLKRAIQRQLNAMAPMFASVSNE